VDKTISMDDERTILAWQDVNHESGRWADRWDYNPALYSILHPGEDEILYLGKADGATVRSRSRAPRSAVATGDALSPFGWARCAWW
jgi:hypothetical protein